MCKQYDIAKNTVQEFIVKKNSFSYEELSTEIKKRGGVLRVAPAYTIKKYLDFYEYEDVISYFSSEGKYHSNCKQIV